MTLMFLVACALSYAVLEAAGRLRAVHGHTRVAWLVAGSIVVGLSIWAMHFVALLELRLPVPLTEDPVTLGVAAVTAVMAAGAALTHVNRGLAGIPALAVSGGLKGFALVATHYTTMAALHVPATIGYDPALFGLSLAVAVGVSTCTLWLAARLRRERAGRAALERLLFAAAMGGGLTLMHLVAVRAGRFVPDAVWREEFRGASVHALHQAWLAPWVTTATVVAAAGLAAAASVSRWREDRHVRRAAGDRLTGLPNGMLLVEQLSATLAHGDSCAVISVRGERFGPLRHRLGPRAGERLLVRVGWRLVAAAGPGALAARMGGVEYAVLVPDARAADAVVARIRERLTVPFSSDEVLVLLPVAVGVAVARPGDTPHGLLARAARAAELAHRRPLAPVAGPA